MPPENRPVKNLRLPVMEIAVYMGFLEVILIMLFTRTNI